MKICKSTHPAQIALEKVLDEMEKQNISFEIYNHHIIVKHNNKRFVPREVDAGQHLYQMPPTLEYMLAIPGEDE